MTAVLYRRLGQERFDNSSRGTAKGIVNALLCSGRGLGMETPEVSTAEANHCPDHPAGRCPFDWRAWKNLIEPFWSKKRITDWASVSFRHALLDRKEDEAAGSLDGLSNVSRGGVKRKFENTQEIEDTREFSGSLDGLSYDRRGVKREFEGFKVPNLNISEESHTDEHPQLLVQLTIPQLLRKTGDCSVMRVLYRKLLTVVLRFAVSPEELDSVEKLGARHRWARMNLKSRPKVFWQAILSVLRRSDWTMGELLKNWAAVLEKDIRTSDNFVRLPCAFRSDKEGQLNLEIDGFILKPHDFKVLRHLMGPLIGVQSTPQGTFLDAHAEDLRAKIDFDLSRDFGADTFDVFHTVITLEPVTVNRSSGLSGLIRFVKSGSPPLAASFTSSVVCPNLLRVLQERQTSLILFDSNNPRTWANLRTIHSSPDSRWTVDGQTFISDASMVGEVDSRGLQEDTVGSEESEDPTESAPDTASSC